MGKKPFFGWFVLIGVGYSLFVGAGMIFYAMSVLLETIVAATGFSVAQISLANTIFLVAGGFAGIAVGELIARYDPRWTVVSGTLLMALVFWLLPMAGTLPQIYAVYIALGIGFAMTSLVPATTLTARWFVRRRALAIALTHSGLSLGGIFLTPVLAELLAAEGLLAMRNPWTLGLMLLNAPLAILLMRPDPQAMGLTPDGDVIEPDSDHPSTRGMVLADAVRSRFFRLFAIASILAMMTQVGTIAHIFKWGLERADSDIAAITVASLAFCSLAGRLVCGVLLDRMNLFRFVLALYLLQGLAMFGMAIAEGGVFVLSMTVLFGLMVGNILMAQPLLVGAAFGMRDFPRILSVQQLVMNGGVALGPILIGLFYDFGGGYQNAFIFVGLCSLMAFGALWRAGPPEQVMAQQRLS
ncbi:MAG: MFS transporter [Parvularculales bacterium]